MKYAALVLILSATCATFAEDKPADAPKSPAAVSALKEYQKASDDADAACRALKIAASKRLVSKLQIAKTVATKAGSLDEALAIDWKLKEATARLEELSTTEGFSTIPYRKATISAKKGWVKILNVHAGDVVEIKATGKWCNAIAIRETSTAGPDGVEGGGGSFLAQHSYTALVGQIGDHVFFVGSAASIVAESDGSMSLGINDKELSDNDGELTVSYRMKAK